MQGNYKIYDYKASAERIEEILSQPAGQFTEENSLPNRDVLTFTNGVYANCSAIFVDLRGSSKLPDKYQRPKLAKLYRAFISEMVAVLNSHPKVREVNIVGDCVWAVYNTPFKDDLRAAYSLTFEANTLTKLLNVKLKKYDFDPVEVGIGAAYGRALMIKAGYNGSAINDVVYMGDVVNRASNLASLASRNGSQPICIGTSFYDNLDERSQGFFTKDYFYDHYFGNVISIDMNDWVESLT